MPIIDCGLCWSTSSNPIIGLNTSSSLGPSTGTFNIHFNGLSPSTTYYIRAYATNSVGTSYGNEFIFTTLPSLSIGISYEGGIIAYILQPGDPGYDANETHGLIAAPNDQSSSINWMNTSPSLVGVFSTALGSGSYNTNVIVANYGSGNYAAKLCSDLVLNGYSDWYLPSKDELNKLFLNQIAIGGFSNSAYWSSNEWMPGDGSIALTQYFPGGGWNYYYKGYNYSVRAIRYF